MSADCPSPDVLHHFRRGELDETAASEVRPPRSLCGLPRCTGRRSEHRATGCRRSAGRSRCASTEPFDSKADAPDQAVMSSLDPDEPSDPRISFVEGQVVFGHFEIVRLLSSGGWAGSTWFATRGSTTPRALKMILRSRFNDLNLKRFRREARVMARLNHPNIVNLVHFDFQDILRPYIVMEFVEGQSLDKVLRGGVPMRLDWTARILEQLCDVLEITHQQDRRSSTATSSRQTSCSSRGGKTGRIPQGARLRAGEGDPGRRKSLPVDRSWLDPGLCEPGAMRSDASRSEERPLHGGCNPL